MHKFKTMYIVAFKIGGVKIHCSNSEGAKEKGKTGWNSVYHKNWGPPHPWMLMFFFVVGFFFFFGIFYPIYDHIQGSSVVFLIYR
jgi:hypothetical protein